MNKDKINFQDKADMALLKVAYFGHSEVKQMIDEIERLQKNCEVFKTILDAVDYTSGNCRPNEMVGAVLPKELLEMAKEVIKWQI